ncbi:MULTISPECIES: hypothetical protein [unclassified Streptomyces]|uniref:hypothetical protein n=1 Tax=unclassified Streptomyces TaxID=2593676 RepID=UPI0024E19293|nr:hypothetical protein [Streptomyces sp. TUS-ST3]
MRQPSLGDGPPGHENDLAVRVSAFQRSEAFSKSAEPVDTFAGDLQFPGGDQPVVAPTARTGFY